MHILYTVPYTLFKVLKREFVFQSKASWADDFFPFLIYDLNVWFRGDIVGRN